jgi:molecular chaperone GrpE (heat shock protein)
MLIKINSSKPIETLDKMFDVNIMEVVAEVEVEGKETGTVIEEMQKGYKYQYTASVDEGFIWKTN